MSWLYRTAIGEDSHRFTESEHSGRRLMLAGVLIPDEPALEGNSDADVVLHAVTNAVSGITGRNILGRPADELCEQGITDSAAYLRLALDDLSAQERQIVHLSISIEARRPKLAPYIMDMKENLARLLGLESRDIGLTATSGEGLTEVGRGAGMHCFAVITTRESEAE